MRALSIIIRILIISVFSLLLLFVSVFYGIYYSYTANLQLTLRQTTGYVQYKDLPIELTSRIAEKFDLDLQAGKLLLQQNSTEYKGLQWHATEIAYTVWAHLNLTEEQKLEYIYNNIYLGKGCYGLSCISSACFGKNIKELNGNDFDLILKLIKSPNRYKKDCPVK